MSNSLSRTPMHPMIPGRSSMRGLPNAIISRQTRIQSFENRPCNSPAILGGTRFSLSTGQCRQHVTTRQRKSLKTFTASSRSPRLGCPSSTFLSFSACSIMRNIGQRCNRLWSWVFWPTRSSYSPTWTSITLKTRMPCGGRASCFDSLRNRRSKRATTEAGWILH